MGRPGQRGQAERERQPFVVGQRVGVVNAGLAGALCQQQVVLLLAVLAAGTAAGLTWLTRRNAAEAVLAGLAVLADGIRFFDWLIT